MQLFNWKCKLFWDKDNMYVHLMLLLRVFNVKDIQTKISDTMMIKFDYVISYM